MTNTNDRTGEPVNEFDQTNGLAGNLEGDDGGEETPQTNESLAGVIKDTLDPDSDLKDDDNSSSGYSEEGRV